MFKEKKRHNKNLLIFVKPRGIYLSIFFKQTFLIKKSVIFF